MNAPKTKQEARAVIARIGADLVSSRLVLSDNPEDWPERIGRRALLAKLEPLTERHADLGILLRQALDLLREDTSHIWVCQMCGAVRRADGENQTCC